MISEEKEVLKHFCDEYSKQLYKNRIKYVNGDINSLKKIVSSVEKGMELLNFMDNNANHLYIFGAGMLGREFFRIWREAYTFEGFVDNDCRKITKDSVDMPVFHFEEIKDCQAAFVIVSKFYALEIKEQLIKCGVEDNRIFCLGEYYKRLAESQYFDLDIFDKNKEEIFIDCGACDGQTAVIMKGLFPNTKKIILLEPDSNNFEKCKKNIVGLECEVVLKKKGVWSSDTILSFDENGDASSTISSEGGCNIETQSIDSILHGECATFIKMDIEGAEEEAIKGAEYTIRKYKPKMAICVYHKEEDIDVIPKLLLQFNPEYKFYLRHYSQWASETVLYAI